MDRRRQEADPLPRPRAARPAGGEVPRRAARVARGGHASAARAPLAPTGGGRDGRDQPARGAARATRGPRAGRSDLTGPALAEAGLLLAAQRRARWAGVARLPALHLADPALPGPRGAPRSDVRAGARR